MILLWPCENIISSASLTTKTSFEIYFRSSSVITPPACLNPLYSISSFLCFVPKLSPIRRTLNGNNFNESLISIKRLSTRIIIVYHCPRLDIEYLYELLGISLSVQNCLFASIACEKLEFFKR